MASFGGLVFNYAISRIIAVEMQKYNIDFSVLYHGSGITVFVKFCITNVSVLKVIHVRFFAY